MQKKLLIYIPACNANGDTKRQLIIRKALGERESAEYVFRLFEKCDIMLKRYILRTLVNGYTCILYRTGLYQRNV